MMAMQRETGRKGGGRGEKREGSRGGKRGSRAHLIGSHVFPPRLSKVLSADHLPFDLPPPPPLKSPPSLQTSPSHLTPTSSEMTSVGSSGFDPSPDCMPSLVPYPPPAATPSILRIPSNAKSDTRKTVGFVTVEDPPEDGSDLLEVAVIVGHKKRKPARRAMVAYHGNCV